MFSVNELSSLPHQVVPGPPHQVVPGPTHQVVPGPAHQVVPGLAHQVVPGPAHHPKDPVNFTYPKPAPVYSKVTMKYN